MLKIEFYLKKPGEEQSNLEYITISNPKKVLEGKFAGQYSCELCLSDIKTKTPPVCSITPIDVLLLALENAKINLQCLVNKGYTISDIENRQEWKLEKKDPQTILQEKIDGIKNSKDISEEDKQKILKSFKEIWGSSSSLIKDQINKLI